MRKIGILGGFYQITPGGLMKPVKNPQYDLGVNERLLADQKIRV